MRLSTLILLALVIALGLYIRFFEQHRDPTDRKREIARRVLRMNPARITIIRVTRPDLQVTLERRDDEWRLVSPVESRADAGAVTRLLDTIELLERGDVIRGREWRNKGMTLADFGLDDPRARIELRSAEKSWTLLVGRDTPVGGTMFIKDENDTSIFVVSTNLLADLPSTVDSLRDKRVFLGFPGDVTRLDLRRREGMLSLTKTDAGTWRMQQPWSGRAAPASVRDLLDQLFTARIVEFIAESFDAAPLYGLDEPSAQASVTGHRRYGEQTLLLGKSPPGDSNVVYATRAGEPRVFTVPRSLLDALQVRAESLRDRRALTFTSYEISSIRIEEGERAILLARDESSGAWELREPVRARADENRIQNALAEWTGLRIEAFIDGADTNYSAWGLAPPARRLVFSRRSSPAESASPRVSSEDDQVVLLSTHAPSNGLITALLAHEQSLIRIQASAAEALPFDPFIYRHPVVLSFDTTTVRILSLAVAHLEQSVLRDAPTNEFRSATQGAAPDPEQVRTALSTLASLRATRFVGPMSDLTVYGLDPPRATLTIGFEGELAPVRALLIGRDSEDGVFAALRGGDAIFVIPADVRDKLLKPLYKGSVLYKDSPVAPNPPEKDQAPFSNDD
ncbi:MAG: DUF4340 domain-containing protein [Kiritimatiellae bacterium]|nr:DUF4340 domain-containing protein [Kiritimatiellia bacterium]MDW8458444.1 DUF4340 domain-containing protein [Verrucomicrobiota bacterium]